MPENPFALVLTVGMMALLLGVAVQAAIPAAIPAGIRVCSQPVAWFKPDLKQVRKVFDPADLQRLGESLREKQLQPLVCLADGTIVCGERRYRAAKLVGLSHLEAKILEGQLTEAQIRAYQITENMQRADLTCQEQVYGCIDFMAINPGLARKDCAAQLYLDPTMVTKLLSYLDAVPIVQKAFDAAQIGLRDLVAIASLPPDKQEGLLNLKLSSGIPAQQLEEQARKQKKGTGTAPAVKVARVKCELPGNLCVVISGDGVSLEEAIEAVSSAMREMKKALEQGLTAKTFAAAMKDKAQKA